MSLECAAKEFLRRMSIIWSSPLSDHNRVTASNQFALPVLGYLMWAQQWPVTELKKLGREVRKIVVENGGKHPSGSTAILYMSREKGGRGLRSIEEEYKVTKIKAAVKLYGNGDSAMAMVREFEEKAEELGHCPLVKEAVRYAEEMGLQFQYPNPTCIKHDSGEVIQAENLKAELSRWLEQKTWEAEHKQNWQGKLISARSEDESLNFEGCFWWLPVVSECVFWQAYSLVGNNYYLRGCMPARKRTRIRRVRWCAGYVIRTLKVSHMSWLVVLPLHRTSTLPDITQPWRYFSSRLWKT